MQPTTFVASLLAITNHALGLPTNGFAKETRTDKYVLDYRVWSRPGCLQAYNLGVGTITSSELDTCAWFFDTVQAFNLTNIVPGCHFYAYTEGDCLGRSYELIQSSGCAGTAPTGKSWVTYLVTCDS
ncbi:hypothetical protein B0H66DRAFT_39203 [Apodospora peruviana]|uniref:Uncharacterized protein n=1 Tax=Apodospora peruviana TaxID=516989 RepID=A0AAE0MEU2_9PEZI|nr:hypothetical protein B0H66DRAFT_39203 [Apodospora peruviana]